jgi:D-alanine-D-alanine ligase
MRSIDKVAAKLELQAAEVATPDFAAFNALAFRELGAAEALEQIEANLGFPLVIKPAAGGSSLGVRFAASADEVPEALVGAFSYDDRVLLERHVEGRELAVSLLSGIALPAVEARPREEDRFSYEARYEIGRTEYVCPADLGAAEGLVIDAALRTWDALGFDAFGRVDLILGEDGPQVLEANAVPGLTDTSLLPMAAEAAGLSFERLCERIVELALDRDGVRSLDAPA